jgi:hypothetical protein
MYQDINEYSFRDAFKRMGREDQFSYEGLGILFNELEQYEVDTGEKIELDVIALCCDYSEMTAEEIQNAYGVEYDKDNESSLEEEIEDFLSANTWTLGAHEKDGKTYYVFRQF